MKKFLVYYLAKDSQHWCSVGVFTARTASGALGQFARDLRHFPNAVAVKAEEQ